MKETINNKVYNTETSTLVKYLVEVEDLGEGYIRYSTKEVYYRDKDGEYFVYVRRVTTEGRCIIFDIQDFIVPVTEDWARQFNKNSPEVYSPRPLDGRPPGK